MCRMRHENKGDKAMKKSVLVLLLLCLVRMASATKIPDSAWQTGTLREITSDSVSRLAGYSNRGHAAIATHQIVTMHYVIDGPGYTYQAGMVLGGRNKQLLVTVRGPIKFALVGHDFYIQDEEGKTKKLVFVTKEIRQ